MIIGIDIDDTITKTSLTAYKYLEKYDSKYNDHHDLTPKLYDEFMTLYIDDIMRNNTLQEGVKEAFDYLNSKGYKIIIITARENKYSDNVIDITKKYLETNGLKYDKILFNKFEKGLAAQENGIQIFIDDKEYVLEDIAKYNIECIRITNEKNSKFKTFTNWNDIIKYLKTKEG